MCLPPVCLTPSIRAFEVYRKINPFEPEIEPSRRKWAVKWRKAIQSVIRRRRLGLSLGGDEDDDAHSYEEDEKSARDYHESRSGNIIGESNRHNRNKARDDLEGSG